MRAAKLTHPLEINKSSHYVNRDELNVYSIADIHLFRLFWRFGSSLKPDPAAFPGLTRHHDRIIRRPAVAKTIEIEKAIGYVLPA